MHLAFLLPRVPGETECTPSAVDGRTLLDLARDHRITIAVDEDSPALTPLRDADVEVHVSDKRHTHRPGGGRVSAEEAVAAWLTNQHEHHALDLVLTDTGRPGTGPVRDALASVAWGVVPSDDPVSHAARLAVDDGWVGAHGHELWTAASLLHTADVVISPVPPEVLQLGPIETQVRSLPGTPPRPAATDQVEGDLVVVTATTLPAVGASQVIDEALATIAITSSTMVVVLAPAALPDARSVTDQLAAGVPPGLERQVAVVPTARGDTAAAWLAVADGLVLAGAAELLVPAIARRAAVLPTVVRGGVPRSIPELVAAPPRRSRPALATIAWDRPAQVAAELRALRATRDLDGAVLHLPSAAASATDLRELAGVPTADVVVVGTPRGPWSTPDATRLDPRAFVLHRRTWHAVAALLDDGEDLAGIVALLTDVAGARSHTLAAVAGDRSTTTVASGRSGRTVHLVNGPVPSLRITPTAVPEPSVPVVTTAAGGRRRTLVGAPTGSVQEWARASTWTERAQIAVPWRFGLRASIADGAFPPDVAAWATRTPVVERLRMVLPWRWGLLPRAMEGRW